MEGKFRPPCISPPPLIWACSSARMTFDGDETLPWFTLSSDHSTQIRRSPFSLTSKPYSPNIIIWAWPRKGKSHGLESHGLESHGLESPHSSLNPSWWSRFLSRLIFIRTRLHRQSLSSPPSVPSVASAGHGLCAAASDYQGLSRYFSSDKIGCDNFASENILISFVRRFKFSGFLKNPVTLSIWLRSDYLYLYACSISIISRGLALRTDLGSLTRVRLFWLAWIGDYRMVYRSMNLCVPLLFLEMRTIRLIILFSRIDRLPVLQPKNLRSFRMRVCLSSVKKIVSQAFVVLGPTLRAMIDHLMVLSIKKVDTIKVSLQSTTVQRLVDWVLLVVLSAVRCCLVNTSGRVFIDSDTRSDTDFGSLAITERFSTKFWSFFSTLSLLSLNLCFCIPLVVDVISKPSVLDVNNASSWSVTEFE